jgi:hypothetical protein
LLIAYVSLSILGAATVACTSKPAEAPPAASSQVTSVLWGDMKPVVSVKELMKYSIDPISDNIFNAVSTQITKSGTVDIVPKTDEDWDKIQTGAVSLAESAYLLKVRRPFTPPGDENDSVGPDAVELSPAEIMAKVEKDPVEWNARIEALRNVALEVMDIVKRRDVAELWDASENLDQACEACHRSYWYPKEDAAFYEKLQRRLEQFREQAPAAKPAPKQ